MFPLVRFWIVLNVVLVAGGWILSFFHALDRGGYLVLALVAAAAAPFALRAGPGERPLRNALPWRRFRRPLPGLFAFLLVPLVLIGGLVSAPHFLDFVAYHIPRLLHWLQAGHWYWIDTPDQRLNNRGAGFEWMSAPLLLFTHSDRGLFLLNFASWLLLPGLLFAFLTGEKVPARTAWPWTWVLSGSFFCVYQAGGGAGDFYPIPLLLAAFVFARRASRTGSFADLGYSLFAAVLPSAHKPFNVVLLLPWAIAALPALRRHAAPGLLLLPLAALCSFAPNAAFNVVHCGDWTGFRAEKFYLPDATYAPLSPFLGLTGNVVLLAVQNLEPPRFPGARYLSAHLQELARFPLGHALDASFEGRFFEIFPSQSESLAGVGVGVALLLIGTALFFRPRRPVVPAPRFTAFDAATGAVFLVFLAKSGAFQAARLAAAFYFPLLVPVLRLPRFRAAVRSRGWNVAAAATLVLSVAALALSTDRPLVPWKALATLGDRVAPGQPLVRRLHQGVAFEELSADYFRTLRESIPQGEARVGLLRYRTLTPASSLWLPYGSRDVVEVTENTPPAWLRAHGVRYVVVPVEPPAVPLRPVWSALRQEGAVVAEFRPPDDRYQLIGYLLLRLE